MAAGLHVSSGSPPSPWRLQQLLLLVASVVSGQGIKRRRSASCQASRQGWGLAGTVSLPHVLLVKASQRPPDTRGGETSSTRRSSKVLSPGVVQGRSEETTCHTALGSQVWTGLGFWTWFVCEGRQKVQGFKEAFENHSMIANSPGNSVNTGVRNAYSPPEEKSSWQEQQGS